MTRLWNPKLGLVPKGMPQWETIEKHLGELDEMNQARVRRIYWDQVGETIPSAEFSYWRDRIVGKQAQEATIKKAPTKTQQFLSDTAESVRSINPVDITKGDPPSASLAMLNAVALRGGVKVPETNALLGRLKGLFADPAAAIEANAPTVFKSASSRAQVNVPPRTDRYWLSKAMQNREAREQVAAQGAERAEAMTDFRASRARQTNEAVAKKESDDAAYTKSVVEKALGDQARAKAARQPTVEWLSTRGYGYQPTNYGKIPSPTTQVLDAAKQLTVGAQMPPNIGPSRTLGEATKLLVGQKPHVFSGEEIASIVRNLAKAKSEQTPLGRLLSGMPKLEP